MTEAMVDARSGLRRFLQHIEMDGSLFVRRVCVTASVNDCSSADYGTLDGIMGM